MRFARSPFGCLALCVALVAALASPVVARAETSADVRAQAARENERLDELLLQIQAGHEEIDGLEQQIDDLADQSIRMQGELIQDRAQLSQMVATSYRWGGNPSLWDIVLASTSLDDFISKLYYAQKVTAWQAGCITQLKDDKRALEEQMTQIEEVRNERRQAVEQLDAAVDELSATVESLLRRADSLEEEERAAEQARLAEAARQAAAEQQLREAERAQAHAQTQARQQAQVAAQEDGADITREEARAVAPEDAQVAVPNDQTTVPDDTEPPTPEEGDEATTDSDDEPAPQPEEVPEVPTYEEPVAEPVDIVPAPAEPQPVEEVATVDAGDWIEVRATAYTIADNTPPGSTATASGIPLDESVPTVALPVSMNPARFYGSKIQIEYQGMTVIATVTDCGSLAGGRTGLDLTPAVFRAFGFDTANAWGVRTVRYRFL